MQKRITINDVAVRAGVSSAVVSRLMNGRESAIPISDQKRAHILKIIQETGYRPNAAARALAMGRSQTLAIVVEHRLGSGLGGGPNYSFAFANAIRRAHEHKFNAFVIFTTGAEGLSMAPLMQEDTALDGVLFLGSISRPVFDAFADRDVPVVQVNGRWEGEINCVAADDVQGARDGVRHLITLGHRRIAIVAGNSPHPSNARRLEGYRLAHADTRLPVDDDLIFTHAGDLLEAVRQQPRGTITAVFCYTDLDMLPVLSGLAQQGMRVPTDMSLVSCNDSAAATAIIPPITSVNVPFEEMAVAGLEMLLERIHTGQPVPSQTLPELLIVRDSCASPAGS